VAVEIRVERVTFLIVSTYFDINRPIEIDLQKIHAILTQAKGIGIILAIDSNARSTSWHDVLTNNRGKKLEEFIINEQLHIANEESSYTFQTERGASNIYLRVLNTQAVDYIKDWAMHEQESCSDHKIIKYEIGNGINLRQQAG
jgi:alkylated DNA nucleotide flippase Atl1